MIRDFASALWQSVFAATLVSIASATLAAEFPRISPKEAGFSSERLARIPAVVQRELDRDMMPGAVVLLARDGQVFYEHTAGVRDIANQTPMTADTLFRIRSMTKPVTGVAGMILVEEGKLRLGDPVSQFVPCFDDLKVVGSDETGPATAAVRDTKVRHLFSHTMGFGYTAPDGSRLHPTQFETLQEFVDNLCAVDLYFEPGASYRYSIANDVLGYVIEQITGQRLGAFMAERIFDPLGMTDTGFVVTDDKLDRFSVTYDRANPGLSEFDRPETSVHKNPDALHSGGGGLISTAEDYLRFAQMLANGGQLDGVRILSEKAVELMTRNHIPLGQGLGAPGLGQGYGLAIGVDLDLGRRGVMGNDGTFYWAGADNTHFWVDPVDNVIGLWMTQVRPFSYDYAHDLRNAVYQAMLPAEEP